MVFWTHVSSTHYRKYHSTLFLGSPKTCYVSTGTPLRCQRDVVNRNKTRGMCYDNPLSHPAPMQTVDCIRAKEKSSRRMVLSYMCVNQHLPFLNHLNVMATYVVEFQRLPDVLKLWNVVVANLFEGYLSYSWWATTELHVALEETLSIATHGEKMHKSINSRSYQKMYQGLWLPILPNPQL